jgi:hypothetical protein
MVWDSLPFVSSHSFTEAQSPQPLKARIGTTGHLRGVKALETLSNPTGVVHIVKRHWYLTHGSDKFILTREVPIAREVPRVHFAKHIAMVNPMQHLVFREVVYLLHIMATRNSGWVCQNCMLFDMPNAPPAQEPLGAL